MFQRCQNMYRQEEAEEPAEAAAAGTGKDLCHLSAYNRRLRATQSPKYISPAHRHP